MIMVLKLELKVARTYIYSTTTYLGFIPKQVRFPSPTNLGNELFPNPGRQKKKSKDLNERKRSIYRAIMTEVTSETLLAS